MNIFFMNLFYFIFLCSVQSMCGAENQQELFEKANGCFKKGKYEQACQLYQSIDNKSFIVLYNMSLTYLHLGKQAQAILSAKRAERIANFYQLTLLYDLFYFMNKKADPDYVLTVYGRTAIFIKKCILSIPMLLVQIFLLLLLIFFIMSWYHCWYQIYKKMLLCMLLLFIMSGILSYYKNYYSHTSIGIVLQDKVNVFAGPDTSFYKKTELSKAEELLIIKKQEKYYQIKAKNIVGWVVDCNIELV